MENGVTAAHLRRRARYWHTRAEKEADTRKRAEYRGRADVLDQEADAIRDQFYALKNRIPRP